MWDDAATAALINKFESGAWMTADELTALAAELGDWVIEVHAEDLAAEAEHRALIDSALAISQAALQSALA